ncbi:MAG TPA: PepSY domain-containing protein [bacterium]|nr:PepSY domain-containing protein [bacterium]
MNRQTVRITSTALVLCLTMAGMATAQVKPTKSTEPKVTTTVPAESGDAIAEPLYVSSLAIGATPTITANQAQAAALAANPGASALSVHLEDENGQLVYAVEMNSGAVVKVDAGNGKILYTDVAESHGEGDTENGRDHEKSSSGDAEPGSVD